MMIINNDDDNKNKRNRGNTHHDLCNVLRMEGNKRKKKTNERNVKSRQK